jgi:hypothetical protein
MNLTESEFLTLRQTIALRGTVRMALLPLTVIGWAAVAAAGAALGHAPLASLLALTVLSAGFEAIHALHASVERIGRYLQVFYEGSGDGPRWETTAMAVGPALPGGGVDPLFTVLFSLAVILNAVWGLTVPRGRVELIVIGAPHVLALIRIGRARWAAARQRAVELESYRAIESRQPGAGPRDA